jgi:predicted Fe-Mo cluster-binding NifX family protein
VDVLICGGIGGGAINALANAGIDLYPGIDGSADMAVMQYLAGVLPKRTDVRCSHHDHEHGEGHDCGSHHDHDCGSHCGGGCH